MDLAYLASLPMEEFAERRQRLGEQLLDNSVAVLFSAQEQTRNNDCTYPFRQDSNFWYLTGFNEPEAALLLIKRDGVCQSVLFLRAKDPLMETWNGRRLGIDAAPSALNVDEAFDIEDFQAKFMELTAGITTLYRHKDSPVGSGKRRTFCEKAPQFTQILELAPLIDEMRLFKSPAEIALMQQAGQISALGHIHAMECTRPNRMEYEIEQALRNEFTRHGARYEAYGSIVAGGDNACILHYTENDAPLKDGELLMIDAGCEFAMYAGDISRTFPINGKFTEPQKAIYELVLKVQKYAIEQLVPNNSIQQVHNDVVRMMIEGLVELGILNGDIDELIAQDAHRAFFMHGLGHWLGLDVHDAGSYTVNSHNGDRNSKKRDRPLEPNMVLTVEPGIYISKDSNAPEQYRGIGVRIEDNILITPTGNKVLTSAVPKEVAEIEALMQAAQGKH